MTKSLSIGWEECNRPKRFTYDSELLSERGPYGSGHIALDAVISGSLQSGEASDQKKRRARLLLVHECEEARRWLDRQLKGEGDVHSVRIAAQDYSADICTRAIKAIEELLRCDKEAAYNLRYAFVSGLASAIPQAKALNVWVPDEKDGKHIQADGSTKEFIESQYCLRTALFHLGEVLHGTIEALQPRAKKTDDPWNWIGNLYVSPPLSRKSRARLTKNRDANLGVAILGLSASLCGHLRLISAKRFDAARYVGEEMPTVGRPCWEVVADYVNVAFSLDDPETPESLRQRWHSFSRTRKVSINNWPEAAIRQPQIMDK